MTRLSLGNYALIAAGVLAVIIAAPAAHAVGAVGAAGAGEELQYVTTTNVNMPGILKMMMGHKMDQPPTTTTISTTRTRHDDGKGNTLIVQCDLRRIININDNNKTYSVTDFDDVMKQVTAAIAAVQAKAGTPPPSTTKINGTGSTTISMDEKTDGQTQVIAGLTAHHAIDTITISTTGTGDCPNMSESMTDDLWYAASPIKMSCPTKLPPPPAMPTGMGPKGGNACAQNLAFQANSVKATQPRIVLKSTMGLPDVQKAGFNMSTTTLVTSLKTQPYDPAFFDVPAGYTKVDAAAMMSPPPHR
jgi:hypothetical protein